MTDRALPIRLNLRDLAAGAAFASMAVSGALPIWATLAFAFGVTLALFDLRVLGRHSSWTAAMLGMVALLLYASVAMGRLDLVVAACTFAALTAICRVLAQPDDKTDGQVFLTSLLMLAGGAALSGEMLFAASLAAFAVLAILSLGLSAIARCSGAGEAIPNRPAIRQLMIGATCALLGGILFFASLPRFSWNLAARRVPSAGALAGFSDRVSLSGDGRIKTNPRIVARLKINPDPAVASLQAYWWARTFDSFNGTEWQTHGARQMPEAEVQLHSAGDRGVHQSIELLPAYASRTLFALQWPISFSRASVRTADGSRRVALTEMRGQEIRIEEAAPIYTYEAESIEPTEVAPTLPPQTNQADYLQLPPDLDRRIADLARSVAGDPRDPVRAAHQLERYLKSHYRYTLELPGRVREPLSEFLFARRAGHCEQFATALTIMLRTLGIPARLATGFFGGERVGGRYVIRAGDAHAWTQLVLPDSRLISLDATPEASRSAQSVAVLDWMVRAYETLSEQWRSSVVDYSLQDQEDLAHWVAGIRGLPLPSRRTGVLGSAGLGAAIVFFWWRLRGKRRRAVGEATAMLDAAERILGRVGLAVRRGECIEEVSRRLAIDRHPISPPVSDLTRRYLQARFGRRPLRPRESAHLVARLAAAARSVERGRSLESAMDSAERLSKV